MAYALRYYKEIAQADGSVIRLEIHKKDSTAEAIEIGAVIQGLSLNIQGQQDEIDTPIQKTSLSMTFVDANDIENGQKNGFWEEFYTPDALLWKVILKAKNASQTSFSTIWGGYVTPDSFSEDLVYRGSVNIIARDNIGHMQDFTFDALGDADGMISLRNLVEAGWEKIASPMELIWDGGDWLSCGDVAAFNTLMNVSMFEGMNWYKAIETALASYGGVMRYVGGNEVIITTLRHLPSFGANVDTLPHIEPVFMSGAQRELVPAVRKIEESVEYDLSGEVQPNISMQDFSGNVFDVETSWGTVEDRAWALLQTAPMYAFGWYNESTYKTLAFNPGAYTIDKLVSESDREAILKSTCILAGTKDDDTHSVSYNMTVGPEDYAINVLFGKFLSVLTNSAGDETLGYPISEVPAEYTVRYAISINDGDNVYYLTSGGIWSQSFASMTMLVSGDKMTINVPLSGEFTSRVLVSITFLNVDMGINALYPKQILGITLTNQSNKPSREKNTVNTIYNADNNVILSRSPEIGPAFDKVALPGFIKNGIFYRSEDDEILPARLWSWGGSEQQMAVWNHLQLLCYYAKPNNLISGTIVNADLSRVANIWVWHGAEHILVSGTYNFLNGRIESAVLREFARYDDMWSEVADASLPETEEDITSNVESGSSAGGSSSTYTATQTVNIGTGGGVGASSLNDLLDVNVESVSAQSVLYYNGSEWVSLSKAVLLSGYVKEDDLASMWSLDDDGNLVTDKQVIIKNNLVINGDTTSTKEGTDAGVSGTVIGIRVDDNTVLEPTNGIVDMSDVLANLEVDVDLSDYYTSQETDAQIANAVAGLNLSQYATKASLATLQTEVDNIEAVLGMDEEAGDIINTWNEVKAFLDGYSSSDDLASILSAMNADIAKRALDSDLDTLALSVEDNTTNIKNLKDSVYTKDDLATYKAWWDDVMSLVVKDGGNIKIKTNLIVEGDTASTAQGTDAGTSGTLIGIVVNGTSYDDETNGMLDLSELMNQYALASAIPSLDGYAKLTDIPTTMPWGSVTNKPTFATVATSGNYSDLSGLPTIPTKTSQLTNDSNYITGITLSGDDFISVSGYKLSLALDAQGGLENTGQGLGVANLRSSLKFGSKSFDGSEEKTITASDLGALTAHQSIYGLTIKNSAGTQVLHYNPAASINSLTLTKDMVGLDNVENKSSATIRGELTSANVTTALGYTPYNATNPNGYISGITSAMVTTALGYTPANNTSLANYLPLSGGTIRGTTSTPLVIGTNVTKEVGLRLEMSSAKAWIGYTPTTGVYLYTYSGAHKLGINDNGVPFFDGNTLIHSGNIGSQSVASATKLATARTIWGQSFDGTGDVSGAMSAVSLIKFSTTKSFYLNSQGHFVPNDKTSDDYWWGVTRNDGNYAISVPAETGVFQARFGAQLAFGSGNVLIGTTTDSGYKLDVAGNEEVLNVSNPTGGNVGIRFSRSTNTSWSMKVAGGNLYINENNSGTTRAVFYESSHGGRLDLAGGLTAGDSTINGNLVVAGDMSSTSDMRLKQRIEDVRLDLKTMAEMPIFTFRWKDGRDDRLHLGSSAQYWEKPAPWLVMEDSFKTLNYAVLGVAGVKALAVTAVDHETRIKMLERKVNELETENRRLRYGS